MRRLYQATTMVPWMHGPFEGDHELFPRDWFAHGIDANRTILETSLRYSNEQGLSPALRTVDELFVEESRNT